jgi:hypothetical protein
MNDTKEKQFEIKEYPTETGRLDLSEVRRPVVKKKEKKNDESV